MKTGKVSKVHVIIRKIYANVTNINNVLAVKTPGHNAMGSQAKKTSLFLYHAQTPYYNNLNEILKMGGVHKVTINLIKLDILYLSVFAIHTNTFWFTACMHCRRTMYISETSVKLWDKKTEPGSSVPKSRYAISNFSLTCLVMKCMSGSRVYGCFHSNETP